jgi:hypothetical protein
MEAKGLSWTIGEEASAALQCIFKVQADAQLTLTGRNTSGGTYDYAKLGDIKEAILHIVQDCGCILMHSISDVSYEAEVKTITVKGAPQPRLVNCVIVSGQVILMNKDNPKDFVSVSCYGTKVDTSSDKTLGAHTIFRRYSTMALFFLDVEGDDPDADNGFQAFGNIAPTTPVGALPRTTALPSLV